jgi:polyhydroxybutyrate depolymerase
MQTSSTAARRRGLALVALAGLVALVGASCGDALSDRPFDVHVPTTYRKGRPAPLLILLHGYALDSKLAVGYWHIGPIAEAHGIIYVAPDGTKDDKGKEFWNATEACCGPANADVDDSAYLAAVIDDVTSRYDVDPHRIFVVGHSNGGFMAYRMACDHADVVAGIVSLEGAMIGGNTKCEPSEPVSVLAIHGQADDVIRYGGGKSPTGSANYPGAVASVKAWAGLDHCDPSPVPGQPPTRTLVSGLPSAQVQAYPGCDDGTAVELWSQPRGGHDPNITPTFTEQVVQFLLAHPKK